MIRNPRMRGFPPILPGSIVMMFRIHRFTTTPTRFVAAFRSSSEMRIEIGPLFFLPDSGGQLHKSAVPVFRKLLGRQVRSLYLLTATEINRPEFNPYTSPPTDPRSSVTSNPASECIRQI